METIRVNMAPCEDIKTIHASQNDNEAREWGFELHNNGEKIDSSSISDQLVFKAYKGGTEQILPTNGSTPTTSPFLGDIRYPQGLLSDQEFLYRESPTEEDGLAKITDIKGNTLNWNQLVQNGNFANTDDWERVNASFSVSNNMATFTASAQYGRIAKVSNISLVLGHKYLHKVDVKTSARTTYMQLQVRKRSETATENVITTGYTTDWQTLSSIFTASETGNVYLRAIETATSDFVTVNLKNWMLIDLTQMGLDSITSADDFTSLFPLSYYAYNQGTLLSFMGNGIKTVGFNQWDEEWEVGAYQSASGQKTDSVRDRIRSKNPIRIFPSVNYYVSKGLQFYYYDANMNFLSWNNCTNPTIITPPSNAHYMNINGLANSGTTYNNDICINISDPSKNGTYEPYTSSTLSLPISTYFPNGMKSAGNVYDELTENKAITRIGTVDMGTLSWVHNSTYDFFYADLLDAPPFTEALQKTLVCPIYETGTTVNSASQMANIGDKTIRGRRGVAYTQIYVKDTSYSSATNLVNALQGIPLYYELSTPTETSFTTASLVTENAEIPLSNEDGTLIGKCTEQLSAEPGFHDAKIKLADEDGECYSNKLQLHVERSPQ